MALRCDACGHVHWKEAPQLARVWTWVRGRKEATSREVADHLGLSVQGANNSLRKLSDLGLVGVKESRVQPGGGRENVFVPTPTHEGESK